MRAHWLQKLSGQQPEQGGPPELRVSTITPASAAILRRIGAWRHLEPPISAAFSSMQARRPRIGRYSLLEWSSFLVAVCELFLPWQVWNVNRASDVVIITLVQEHKHVTPILSSSHHEISSFRSHSILHNR